MLLFGKKMDSSLHFVSFRTTGRFPGLLRLIIAEVIIGEQMVEVDCRNYIYNGSLPAQTALPTSGRGLSFRISDSYEIDIPALDIGQHELYGNLLTNLDFPDLPDQPTFRRQGQQSHPGALIGVTGNDGVKPRTDL